MSYFVEIFIIQNVKPVYSIATSLLYLDTICFFRYFGLFLRTRAALKVCLGLEEYQLNFVLKRIPKHVFKVNSNYLLFTDELLGWSIATPLNY